MKTFNLCVLIAVCSLVGQWFVFLNPMVHAEDSIDCTDVRVFYVDDPSLTHEERLRLMDKAFLESLNKYELCRSAKEKAAASEGAANNGATTDSGNSLGGSPGDSPEDLSRKAGGISAGESIASSAMSGTEAPEKQFSAEEIETDVQVGEQGSQNPKEAIGNTTNKKMEKSNGKLPEDIPTAQNDDALAAQIRYAAENETDPVKREQLWNEYRKYKGLPTQ